MYAIVPYHPPANEQSREVANFTEKNYQHTPVYGVKEFVCLSVVNFDPNYTDALANQATPAGQLYTCDG